MTRRLAISVDIVVAAFLAGLVLTFMATAHGVGDWYKYKYEPGDRSQHYGFEDSFPTGSFRDRVENGAQEWNSLVGELRFARGGVNVNFNFENCDDPDRQAGDNAVFWGSIPGPTTGLGGVCLRADGEHIKNTRLMFDSSYSDWYTGTGSPGSNKSDVWTVASHEWGHGAGFGLDTGQHWDESSSLCPPASDRHVMCPTYALGTTYQRNPEEHDRHTFNSAYESP